jgi:hypothetical protein
VIPARSAASTASTESVAHSPACARAHASEGEIIESLQQVFGDYTETPVF